MKIEEIQKKVTIPNEQGIVKKRGIYFILHPILPRIICFACYGAVNIPVFPPIISKEKAWSFFWPSVFFPESCILNIREKILRLKKAILFFWIAEKSIIIM